MAVETRRAVPGRDQPIVEQDDSVSAYAVRPEVKVASMAAGTAIFGGTRDAGDAYTPTRTLVSSADASGAVVDASPAPTSGQKIVVVDVLVAAAAAMRVDFKIETAGDVIFAVYVPANGTVQFTPRGLLKLATADKKLQVQTSAAGAIRVMTLCRSES